MERQLHKNPIRKKKKDTQWPTWIRENSNTAIDDTFLDISTHDNYKVQPVHNGLSDEAQLLTTDTASGHFKNYQTVFQWQINK
jgi:hypothetical protein